MIPKNHFHHQGKLFINNFFLITIFLFFQYSTYIETMRVHPMANKRNASLRDDPDLSAMGSGNANKKLRRLPHVFSKVLELPFGSDADVEVEEGSDFFRFIAQITVPNDRRTADVKAYAVEIHPGVIKIVIRHDQNHGGGVDEMELLLDKLEVDTWRYRLPSSSRPELATAAFVDGELIVTVPKGGRAGEGADSRAGWGGASRLVLAQ